MFRGHSGRITNLKFSKDGKYLLSTGGRDKCIFQWRYIANIPSKEEDEVIIDPTLIVDEPSRPFLSWFQVLDCDTWKLSWI